MIEEKQNNIVGEIARTAVIFALTSVGISKTPLGKSKVGALASIFTAGAIATATNGGSSEEENWKTLGSFALGLGMIGAGKSLAKHKGFEILNFVNKLDEADNTARTGMSESIQKFSEWKRENSIFSLYTDPNSVSKFSNIFNPNIKSAANTHYNADFNAQDYKSLYYAGNRIDGPDANYIVKTIKKEDGNGRSIFKNILSAYNKDGSFNLDTFVNDKTIFGTIKNLLETSDEAGSSYLGLLRKDMETLTSFDDYVTKSATNKDASFLMDRFSKFAKDESLFVKKNKNQVTFGEFVEKNPEGEALLEKTSKYLRLDSESTKKMFGNLVLDGLQTNKQGKIYDASAVTAKRLTYDLMGAIDSTLRPVFSFLPGESIRNFSLLPAQLGALAKKEKYSKFQIFKTATNYKGLEKAMETKKQQILNETGEVASLRNNFVGDWRTKKSELLDELERLKIKTKYNENLNSGKADFSFPQIADDIIEGQTALNFSYDKNGVVNGFKPKNYGTAMFLDHESQLFYRDRNGAWNKKAGRFELSSFGVTKDNQSRFMGSHVTANHFEAGMSEDKYYENNVLERTKEIAALTKNKFLAKKNKLFNDELNDYVSQLETVRKNAVINKDKDLISKFRDAEQITLSGFGLNATNAYNKTWNAPDLKNFEASIKENLVRKLVSNGAITDLSPLEKNQAFNKHYFENTFYKSVFDSEKPTIVRKFGSLVNDDSAGRVFKENGQYKLPETSGTKNYDTVLGDVFVNDSLGTNIGAHASDFVQRFQNSLNIIGLNNRGLSQLGQLVENVSAKTSNQNVKNAGKFVNNFFSKTLYIDPNKDTFNAANHFSQIMMKRVLPVLGMIYGAKAINGATDTLIPDSVYDGGIGNAAASAAVDIRVGFQALLETTGIRGAANWMVQKGFDPFLSALELDISADEFYDRHVNGKAVPIKRNRFWFGSNRTPFSGTETSEYRQSLMYRMQHRDTGVYDSKMERFIREDFLATKLLTRLSPEAFSKVDLLNPYLEEKRALERGLPMAKSEQLFDDIPLFGEALSNSIGELIKPTKYYDGKILDPLSGLRSFEKGFEDLKTMGGYQGYFITAASNFLFKNSKVSDYLRDNYNVDTREDESIDRATNITSNFYDLQLGGLLGVTEPIRRIFTNNMQDTKNDFGYQGEEWFRTAMSEQTSHLKNNTDYLKGTMIAPGENYRQNYGLNSDRSGEYGALDRMLILANNAPHSVGYVQAKSEALKELKNGNFSAEQQLLYYRALSIESDLKDRNDIVKEDNYVKNADLFSTNLKIDSVVSANEFRSGNFRVKLAGVNTDFGSLSNNYGEQNAAKMISGLQSYLSGKDSIDVLYNQNKRVKIDNKGEYLEVYAPELDSSFDKMKSDSYLRTMSAQSNPLERFIEKGFQGLRSFSGPAPLMNIIGKRNAFTQWYRESEQMPAFRSWENPYASFVDPIYSLAENPVQNAFLLYNLGNMGTVFNGLDRVRDVTSTSGVLLLGGLKSALNSDKTPSNYRMEDQIQLKFEQNKKTAGAMNYYDLNTNSTQSQLKSSLTYDESMAFNDLMNSNNLGAVTDVASERFQNIIALEQTKMNNYISNNDTFIERLGTYKTTQISDNYVSNDYFYNLAVAKQSIGYSLESLEKEKISNYQMNSSLSPSVSYDTLRNRYFGGKINSKVTSTIYTGTNSNKKY